jgi:hypothetical protein
MEYLINVALAATSYWATALVFGVTYLFFKHKAKTEKQPAITEDSEPTVGFYTEFAPKLGIVTVAVFVLGIAAGMTSPSNTYKHTVDYNKSQDIQRIQQLNSQRPPAEIQDISRQPQTTEERASSSIDMRTRVESMQEQ